MNINIYNKIYIKILLNKCKNIHKIYIKLHQLDKNKRHVIIKMHGANVKNKKLPL